LNFATHNVLPNVLHQIIHVVDVMLRCQCGSKRFIGLKEMPDVGTIVVLAGCAIALIVKFDTKVFRIAARFNLDVNIPCQYGTMTRYSSRIQLSKVSMPWATAFRVLSSSAMPNKWRGLPFLSPSSNLGIIQPNNYFSSCFSLPKDPPMAYPSKGSEAK
jgi:hypothetical protein